jgi:hypothetical protein
MWYSARAMKAALAIALVVAASACGSKPKPEPAKPAEPAEHHEMAGMPPELGKFHDVLAPRWHAESGPQRMKDTCAAVPGFTAAADALTKAKPPAGANANAWAAGTKELVDAVTGLKASCDSGGATAFEPAFERVHNSFHALMESHEHAEH